MRNNRNAWIIQVQPGRYLTVGYDEDVPHPGGVFLDGPQRITEFLVVFEATGGHVLILFGLKENVKIIICTSYLCTINAFVNVHKYDQNTVLCGLI